MDVLADARPASTSVRAGEEEGFEGAGVVADDAAAFAFF